MHVIASPFADDGPPAAQRAPVEGPVDHFFHVVVGAEFGVHARRRVSAVRQLQLVGRIHRPVVQELQAPFHALQVSGITGFLVGVIQYPGVGAGGFRLRYTGRVGLLGFKIPGAVVHVGLLPGRIISAHAPHGLQETIGYRGKLEISIAADVRIKVVELVEKDVGHQVVPPVVAAAAVGVVEVNALAVVPIEEILAHQHPVPAVLVGLVRPGQGSAHQRRQHVDGFAVLGSTGTDVGVQAKGRILWIVESGGLQRHQGQILAGLSRIVHEGIVAQCHLLPVAQEVGRRHIGHQFYPRNGNLARLRGEGQRRQQEKDG